MESQFRVIPMHLFPDVQEAERAIATGLSIEIAAYRVNMNAISYMRPLAAGFHFEIDEQLFFGPAILIALNNGQAAIANADADQLPARST